MHVFRRWAKLGDKGSSVLPYRPTGVVWKRGGVAKPTCKRAQSYVLSVFLVFVLCVKLRHFRHAHPYRTAWLVLLLSTKRVVKG